MAPVLSPNRAKSLANSGQCDWEMEALASNNGLTKLFLGFQMPLECRYLTAVVGNENFVSVTIALPYCKGC